MSAAGRILIVGGGIAGQAVAEELRRRDPAVELTLVCAEQAAPYDRVRLSHLLAGEASADELRLRPDEWYADRAVDLLLGRTVATLDLDAGLATLDDGRVLQFDQVALTTGSEALLPPLPGLDLPGVHAFRDPADCAAITSAAASGISRAAVIGGGLLGLEAAYGLVQRGVAVTVVHLMDRLMERQLDAAAGALLLPAIEALGVEVLLEHATAELLPGDDGRVAGLRFASGAELPADLVVVSIGIKSRTDLARAARPGDRPRHRRRRPPAHEPPARRRGRRVRRAPRDRLRHRRADPRAGGGRGRHAARPHRPRLRGLGPDGEAEGDGDRPRHRRRRDRRPRRRRHGRQQLPQGDRRRRRPRARRGPARRHARRTSC